ncbi:uncharacterized protein J3R85_000039 [Psidium guajava]|nr:uncharacterized protein J3R85_000039 [Psidium guajava]
MTLAGGAKMGRWLAIAGRSGRWRWVMDMLSNWSPGSKKNLEL